MGEKFIDDENDKNQGPKFRLILDNQRLVAELQRQLLARERERQRQAEEEERDIQNLRNSLVSDSDQ